MHPLNPLLCERGLRRHSRQHRRYADSYGHDAHGRFPPTTSLVVLPRTRRTTTSLPTIASEPLYLSGQAGGAFATQRTRRTTTSLPTIASGPLYLSGQAGGAFAMPRTRRKTRSLPTIASDPLYLSGQAGGALAMKSSPTLPTPLPSHFRRKTWCQTTRRGTHFSTPRAYVKSNGTARLCSEENASLWSATHTTTNARMHARPTSVR